MSIEMNDAVTDAVTRNKSGGSKKGRTVTDAMRAANKRNAQQPRPGGRAARGPEGEVLKAALAEARSYTHEAILGLVALFKSKDEQVRLRAYAEVLNRGGVPARSEAALELVMGPPKMFDFRGEFTAPPGYDTPLVLDSPMPPQLEARASLPQADQQAPGRSDSSPQSCAAIVAPEATVSAEDEARRRREWAEIEKLTADDDSTGHLMDRATRGWR